MHRLPGRSPLRHASANMIKGKVRWPVVDSCGPCSSPRRHSPSPPSDARRDPQVVQHPERLYTRGGGPDQKGKRVGRRPLSRRRSPPMYTNHDRSTCLWLPFPPCLACTMTQIDPHINGPLESSGRGHASHAGRQHHPRALADGQPSGRGRSSPVLRGMCDRACSWTPATDACPCASAPLMKSSRCWCPTLLRGAGSCERT